MSLLMVLRSRRNTIIQLLTDAVLNISAISTSFLLAARFDGIGPWSKSQVAFMLGYAILVNGILDSFFGYNIRMISRRIGRGQLDHLLLQPQPLWRALLTEGFTPFTQPFVIVIALAFLAWSSAGLPVAHDATWFAMVGLNVIASCGVVLAFQMLWGSLAFWAPLSAEEINAATNRMVRQLGTFPLDAARRSLNILLLTVVPVGFTAWFPAKQLVGQHPLDGRVLVTPLVALILLALAALVFSKGLRHYVTVGSQRYSAFGHRR
jgi:ABC-2 type transport system permease protein